MIRQRFLFCLFFFTVTVDSLLHCLPCEPLGGSTAICKHLIYFFHWRNRFRNAECRNFEEHSSTVSNYHCSPPPPPRPNWFTKNGKFNYVCFTQFTQFFQMSLLMMAEVYVNVYLTPTFGAIYHAKSGVIQYINVISRIMSTFWSFDMESDVCFQTGNSCLYFKENFETVCVRACVCLCARARMHACSQIVSLLIACHPPQLYVLLLSISEPLMLYFNDVSGENVIFPLVVQLNWCSIIHTLLITFNR